ncbi:WD40 repeat-containing protein [Tieghemostelium lacteum]|uniref:WD40 repeat-containing protein n=1 Tax=Tieghemostelium lacteum TaxID=361077 RepID=A0A151ZK90_TIELA|nr:WD40 repeat-containing protein [Tieghemostelium lacteum]|eukprot:KYQ94366.1 WD40 repeat-containing protein [Tieghemostelium lacteum]
MNSINNAHFSNSLIQSNNNNQNGGQISPTNGLNSGSTTPPLFGKNADIMVPVVLWCGSPSHWISSIILTPDKRTIITGSQSGHIIISSISLDQGKENQFLPKIFAIGHESPVTCLALGDFEGKEVVISASSDGSMAVWNIVDGNCLLSTLPHFLFCSPSTMVSLPNKKQVAVVGKGSNSIYIVDIHTLKLVSTLTEHTNWITSLFSFSLSEDQAPMLLSGSLDGTIRFWSLKPGESDFPLQIICLTQQQQPATQQNPDNSNSTNGEETSNDQQQAQLTSSQQTSSIPQLGMEYCSQDDAPLSIEISPNGKSLLVVTKNHWSIFTTNNSHRLYSVESATTRGWFGGNFVNNNVVLIYSGEGTSYLYKVDTSLLKSFSLGQPIPLPGTSPLITTLSSSSLSKSYGSLSSSSSQNNLSDVLGQQAQQGNQIKLSYICADITPPSLIMMFNENNQSSGKESTNSNSLKSSLNMNIDGHLPPSFSQYIKTIGAAYCFSNIFMIGDSFGKIKIWVIPVNGIDQGSTTIVKKSLREPNLIGNIHDGWRSCESKPKQKVTASLILEDQMILIRGHEDGSISTSKLPSDLLSKLHPSAHNSRVNCLMRTPPGNTKSMLFSASNDTTIKVWDLNSFQLLHTFSHHTGPVTSIFPLPHPRGRNHFMSISEDKTIGMYTMDDMSCKHMFGVHPSSISKVHWKSEQGYLIVDTIDGSVSIWEIGSGELEGTVYGQNAKDILDNSEILSNNWKQQVKLTNQQQFTTKSMVYSHKSDSPIQTLFLNVKTISDEITKFNDLFTKYNSAISASNTIMGNNSNITYVQKELNQLISIISYFIPWGMDKQLDPMFKKDFQLRPPQPDFSFGLLGHRGNISFLIPSASHVTGKVQCSELLTAQTTLAAVSLSRSLSKVAGVENVCSQLTTYYCTTLPETLSGYIYPDYCYLTQYCQDNSEDVMVSSRSIFKTTIDRMSTNAFKQLVSGYWNLLNPENALSMIDRSRAVIVLAIIASHRPADCNSMYSSKVGSELIKMIYKGTGNLTITAVEQIGRGFALWKDSIRDLPGLLKCLFSLTMQSEPLAGTSRTSLLMIGTLDPKNFIQVIADEITNESTGFSSTINAIVLIASLIRKEPETVLPYLPRIIESIIKSLDPHTPNLKEQCLRQTTVVLHLMVVKYPMVSFHSETQRLALGTLDGFIVIYDLKTATRWHRIEAHEHSFVSAVEFNENGKGIASYSSKDNTVRIWHASSSFFGLGPSQFTCIKSMTPNGLEKSKQTVPKIEFVNLKWQNPSTLLLIRDDRSCTFTLDPIS